LLEQAGGDGVDFLMGLDLIGRDLEFQHVGQLPTVGVGDVVG
jgi:hypothetical protein